MSIFSSSLPPTPCPFVQGVSPNPAAAGGVQVGSNGSGGSSPGALVGHNLGSNPISANITWDSNVADGFDSGWVSIQLVGEAGGGGNGVTWTIIQPDGTTTTLPYSGVSYGTIDNVQLQAAASAAGMKVSFKSVSAVYSQNGQPTETVTLPDECAPIADTTGAGAPGSASEVSQLSPGSSGNTSVVITAMVRMESSGAGLPAPDAMAATIYIFAQNPTP